MKKIFSTGWRIIRIAILAGLIFITGSIIWAATLQLPTLNNFEERRALQSTKIYDRTGEFVLFDFNQDVRRTEVELEEISEYLQQAAIAIEDDTFYEHSGVRPESILRAAVTNLREGGRTQGGSTITQQVVKNALLTREKSYTRKIKEAILAIRLERLLEKDEILEIYLNESPYGGTIYGAEEAARSFFNKTAAELTLAEAAYLAALPQAPTYYSPYGENVEALQRRQSLVLDRMVNLGYITPDEASEAKDEEVAFKPRSAQGIRAPHFVFYVRSILEEQLGTEVVENGGLRVITTLDLELQEEAEDIVKRYGERNIDRHNAENAAAVAIDPDNGQILSMVGSRDWFDDSFDGKFNAATALRQPGSTFKPFIYATAFDQGYTPDTVLFDLRTQFNVNCPAGQFSNDDGCYAPINYDGSYKGPMTIRQALAQSRNIPAVKAFYLSGLQNSVDTAESLGISTLNDIDQYGLTLVLGGGEVTLVDMTGAYAGFANDGRVAKHTPILEVIDKSGDILLETKDREGSRILDRQVARQINSILSDNAARTPLWGANSLINIPNTAAKSGTTNNSRDAWLVGYNTDIVIGVWAGNNDNRSMNGLSGLIVSPIWNEIMNEAIDQGYEGQAFARPDTDYDDLKPILRGVWRTGGPNSIHSILAWVDRQDPLGPPPQNPQRDNQFQNWETSVRRWVASGAYLGYNNFGSTTGDYQLDIDNRNVLNFEILGAQSSYNPGDVIDLVAVSDDQIDNMAVFIDGNLAGSTTDSGVVSFTLDQSLLSGGNRHTLRILLTGSGKVGEFSINFTTDSEPEPAEEDRQPRIPGDMQSDDQSDNEDQEDDQSGSILTPIED
jgi:1A family penicillin-binding protein